MIDINKIVSARWFKWTLFGVAELILLAVVFSAGMKIGLRKADFSYAFGANYERNFAGPPRGPGGAGGPMGAFRDIGGAGGFRNSSGVSGTVISTTDSTIVIKDSNNNENTISVNGQTLIKYKGGDVKISDIKNDQKIVAIGKPDSSGEVVAELIRVFDNNTNNNTGNNTNNN